MVRKPWRSPRVLVLIPALACNALLGNTLDDPRNEPAEGGVGPSGDASDGTALPRPRCSIGARLSRSAPVASHACSGCPTRNLRYDGRGVAYWSANNGGAGFDLFAGSYDDAGAKDLKDWFGQVNGVFGELVPTTSSDGLTLVFQSSRAGGQNLFVAKRSAPELPFEAPRSVDTSRTPAQEPYLVGDHLYYASLGALFVGKLTVTETRVSAPDLERFGFTGASFPVVSVDEREIFFGVSGSNGVVSIWYAQREEPTIAFGTPVRLDALSDPNRDTRPSWLSPDGCYLLLARFSASGGGDPDLLSISREP